MLNDFNWEDNAFSIIHRYEPKIATMLSQQSEYAYEMTNCKFGKEDVDTTHPFRNAITKYL